MAMASQPDLSTARISLGRLLDRVGLLDQVAEGGAGISDLLSAACELQLDLQLAPTDPRVDRARRLARELCSELSHLSPGHRQPVRSARRILGKLERALTGDEPPGSRVTTSAALRPDP